LPKSVDFTDAGSVCVLDRASNGGLMEIDGLNPLEYVSVSWTLDVTVDWSERGVKVMKFWY